MTLEELKQHLSRYEWRDIEFKEATFAVPNNAYESVSAFANTEGGWIVFGVKKKNAEFEILGVADVDKMQNEFLNTLRTAGKLSVPVRVREDLVEPPEGPVLVFYVSEATRHEKPVYLDGDPRKSFIRRGGSDNRCNEEELKHYIREASRETYDSQIVELDAARCFDAASLTWYRQEFNARYPGHETSTKPDLEFLEHFGLVQHLDAHMRPTRAAVLLFGSDAAIHQILPRQIVDFFLFRAQRADVLPSQRWDDRIASLSEGNIIKTWRRVVELYQDRFAEQRFTLDPTSLQSTNSPPDYRAFRESILNLLIHQDYGDHSRKARITFYADESVFWNSGASFVTGEDLFRQDVEKDVRNPRIRHFLNRIGIGEAANTGIKSIFAFQHQLGRLAPHIANDVADRSFCITLSKGTLLTARQAELKRHLGVSLSDAEAALFVHVRSQPQVRILEAQSVTSASKADTLAALDRLVLQRLLERHEDGEGIFYVVASHLSDAASLDPVQAAQNPVSLDPVQAGAGFRPSARQWEIMALCDSSKSIVQLMRQIGLTGRPRFRRDLLAPLVTHGVLRLSDPTKPTSPRQTYVLTDAGFELLEDKKKGLFTEQAAPVSGAATEQASTTARLGHSATDQVSPKSPKLGPSPTDQATASTGNLVTDQADRPAGNLVTPAVTKLDGN